MLGRPGTTIGELGQRVDLERRSDDPAAGGGTTETYAVIATVWAKVEAVSGSLYFASQQVNETSTHAVTIRTRRNDWQRIEYIRWSRRSFRVERVRDLDPEYTEILCQEIESLVPLNALRTGSGNVVITGSGNIVTTALGAVVTVGI